MLSSAGEKINEAKTEQLEMKTEVCGFRDVVNGMILVSVLLVRLPNTKVLLSKACTCIFGMCTNSLQSPIFSIIVMNELQESIQSPKTLVTVPTIWQKRKIMSSKLSKLNLLIHLICRLQILVPPQWWWLKQRLFLYVSLRLTEFVILPSIYTSISLSH